MGESDQASADFGYSVASAGDVNGDGYDDVIVGAPYYTNGQTNEGRVYVYYGSAGGLSPTYGWTAESDRASALFGRSVASAGDVNGDGFDDVIVGAYAYTNEKTNEGRAYLYIGSSSGLSNITAWTAESDQTSALFGNSVASAGDVNGDGFDDIIVGAYVYDNGQTDEGCAFAYYGGWYRSGIYTSQTFGSGGKDIVWSSLEWMPHAQQSKTHLGFQFAVSKDGTKWDFMGPGNARDDLYTQNKDGTVSIEHMKGRFFKYRVFFSTEDKRESPRLSQVTVNYHEYDTPTVLLTSPNGGEDWMRGSKYPITWSATGAFNDTPICLSYSTNNGTIWKPITSWIPNNGVYTWTLPNVGTPGAMVRVNATDIYGNTVSDTSDATFAIDPPPGSLAWFASPASGAVWGAETQTVTWNVAGLPELAKASLEFSSDGGTNWDELATGMTASGTYYWTVPAGISSDNCLLRLGFDTGMAELELYTSARFTVDTKAPVLTHTAVTKASVGVPVSFVTSASDDLSVQSVIVYYKYESDSGTSYQRMELSGDAYTADVTFTAPGKVTYYIQATDGANVANTPTYTMAVGDGKDGSGSDGAGSGSGAIWVVAIVFGIVVLLVIVGLAAFMFGRTSARNARETDTTGKDVCGKASEKGGRRNTFGAYRTGRNTGTRRTERKNKSYGPACGNSPRRCARKV